MATFNIRWTNALVKTHVFTQMVSNAIQNDAIRLLNDVEADMRDRLGRSARNSSIYRYITDVRTGAWRKVQALVTDRIEENSVNEVALTRRALVELSPVVLDVNTPNVARIKRLSRITPIEGRTLTQWLDEAMLRDIDRMNQQIRIGLSQGEDNSTITRRVLGTVRNQDGANKTARTAVRTIVRTATNRTANIARQEFYQENSDLFDEERYVATLDSRTTIQCGSLDGKVFPLGKGPMPPIHINCRSTRIPVITDQIGNRPAVPVVERQLLREYANRNNLGNITSRARLPRGQKGKYDSYARTRKRELIGRVPARTTYEEFLRGQSREFQDTVLGSTRARLWREGNLSLDRFVDRSNVPYTIDRLRQLQGEAFDRVSL